jgi:mevalonate kinase
MQIQQIAIPECPILIVDSGRPRQTHAAVTHVRNLLLRDEERYSHILRKLGELAVGFCEAADGDKGTFLTENFPIAQGLLDELGLGCPEVDAICEIARRNGLAAKISGAGMGGIVLVTGEGLQEKVGLFDAFNHFTVQPDVNGFKEEECRWQQREEMNVPISSAVFEDSDRRIVLNALGKTGFVPVCPQ